MSTATPPVVIFDLGGVLIDWDPRYLYRRLFRDDSEAMEYFLREVCSPEWNARQDAGRPFADATSELISRHPERAQLIRAYDVRWAEMVRGAIEPTVEILGTLKENSHPLFALSNWSAEKFPFMRTRFRFLEWFQDIVLSGEVGLVKPDPRIYALLLERVGEPAARCIFIDDSAANVEAAERLGFQTIHFRTADRLALELGELGVNVNRR